MPQACMFLGSITVEGFIQLVYVADRWLHLVGTVPVRKRGGAGAGRANLMRLGSFRHHLCLPPPRDLRFETEVGLVSGMLCHVNVRPLPAFTWAQLRYFGWLSRKVERPYGPTQWISWYYPSMKVVYSTIYSSNREKSE